MNSNTWRLASRTNDAKCPSCLRTSSSGTPASTNRPPPSLTTTKSNRRISRTRGRWCRRHEPSGTTVHLQTRHAAPPVAPPVRRPIDGSSSSTAQRRRRQLHVQAAALQPVPEADSAQHSLHGRLAVLPAGVHSVPISTGARVFRHRSEPLANHVASEGCPGCIRQS